MKGNNIIIPVVTINMSESFVSNHKNKSGIYRIICLVGSKFYIGSSRNLNQRFNSYKYPSQLMNSNMNICKDILKYGHMNFSFSIIEYCEPSLLKYRERYYMGLLKPQYNTKRAYSSLGFKY